MSAGVFEYYIFEKNLQGDITAVYDEYGGIIVEYTYDAWGNVTKTLYDTTSNGQYNSFRYRGYFYDEETGLYYLNSRYYDPAIGRFLNADVFINANGDLTGFNMYAYCSNNPVMGYDPTGEFICAAIGALVGAAFGAIGAALNGDDIVAGATIGAATGAISGLAVDVGIATGGIGGLAIAVIGGGVASAGNYIATEEVNDREPSIGMAVFNGVMGGIFNGIAFSFSEGSLIKNSGNILTNILKHSVKTVMKHTSRLVAGELVKKTAIGVIKNVAKNIANEIVTTARVNLMQAYSTKVIEETIIK